MATAGPWSSLGAKLHPSLRKALMDSLSLPTMTPVQAAAIPPLLTNKDVCVDAETGSGKTLSYLVPVAQTLLFALQTKPSAFVRALVVLPTRELASQVHTVAESLFGALPGNLSPAPLIGGGTAQAGPGTAHTDLRLVIATPGRLAAALAQSALNVSKLELLVLDEADRLLDMGFSVTLTDILMRLPRQRRTGIYSATQTAEVDALARAGLRNPVRVAVRVAIKDKGAKTGAARQRVPASLRCVYQIVSPRDKLACLVQLLARHRNKKFIVYFITCACVEYFRRLPLEEMLAEAEGRPEGEMQKRVFSSLHGKLSQKKRDRALAQFAASDNGVLLCTDVAARGIDVPDVDWVVQFDAPQDPDAYIHRVGRTARLGRIGDAVIFLAPSEDAYAEFLKVRRCPVEPMEEVEEFGSLAKGVAEIVRKATLADRAVLEASESAFLSYIRAYKEHRCRFLLKLAEIDVNSIADSFGLLRLPKFHEFKKLRGNIKARNEEGIVIRDIAFKDRAREKRRQQVIRERIANRAQWKAEFAAKKKKGKKRKRGRKRDSEEPDAKRKGSGNASAQQDEENEEEDFGNEAAQLRKLKNGKISVDAFDAAAGYDDLQEEEIAT